MKNCIRPPYKKLKSLKSGFIENSNFENDRDPWSLPPFTLIKGSIKDSKTHSPRWPNMTQSAGVWIRTIADMLCKYRYAKSAQKGSRIWIQDLVLWCRGKRFESSVENTAPVFETLYISAAKYLLLLPDWQLKASMDSLYWPLTAPECWTGSNFSASFILTLLLSHYLQV